MVYNTRGLCDLCTDKIIEDRETRLDKSERENHRLRRALQEIYDQYLLTPVEQVALKKAAMAAEKALEVKL